MSNAQKKAVFLDRDGVLIEDIDLLTEVSQIQILPNVPEALRRLALAGFDLVVVSNQTVVARGMATEAQVDAVNREIATRIAAAGGPLITAFYICPHHPKATLADYRLDCTCRKPRPGLLLKAAQDEGIDLHLSFMIGDRVSDIAAGQKAGTRTVLVQTGKHTATPIITSEPMDPATKPDHACSDLAAAAEWILAQPNCVR